MLGLAAHILILVGLLRVLSATSSPFLCSGIYAVLVFILGISFGGSVTDMLARAAIALALASFYFVILNRLENNVFWWPVMVAGLAIGLI